MAINTNAVTAAPEPEKRLRSAVPVTAASVAAGALLLVVSVAAVIVPQIGKARAAADELEVVKADQGFLLEQQRDLEVKRDRIIEQYDAIRLFTERYPSTPRQDSLFRDLQFSAPFAGVKISSIATEYPQILKAGSLDGGASITPDQIVVGGPDQEDAVSGQAHGAPGTDVSESDTDKYPLGTVPLTVNASVDGSRVFQDSTGQVYVASPSLGLYTFGGDTGVERLTLGVARDMTPAEVLRAYTSGLGDVGSFGYSVFNPDWGTPPYAGLDAGKATSEDLIAAFPYASSPETGSAPQAWLESSDFLPLSDVSRSAWLIDEVRNSPGRAILVRFVSASGSTIVISGQQFILRDLPPLPEDVFGTLALQQQTGDADAAPTASPAPRPTHTPVPESPRPSAAVSPAASDAPTYPSTPASPQASMNGEVTQ